MIIDTLQDRPFIGIISTLGSGTLHWTGIINPILSFFSLIIGITVGLVTLYLQINKLKR